MHPTDHKHNYMYYKQYDQTEHKSICFCGTGITEAHTIDSITLIEWGVEYGRYLYCGANINLEYILLVSPIV